ncbi:N-acetylmuramoyl-L-alanine amidase [Halalkalibacter wakoensis]|uniref:N-acetylmuramoyl-L-alanine amidase n=1 Tax=Halalkalibacter wakoensis TaxID=127891 RepID=UPI0034E2F6DA
MFRGNNGRFSPSDPISKAHVAIILTRAFNLTGTQTSHFSDVSADFYAVREISALERNGIVERASRFQPNQSATRAQFAAYVARSFEPSFRLDVTEQSVLYQGKVANTSTPLNVRSQPNMDGDVLARLTVGTTVDILGEVGNWFEIKHGNGVAYVHKNYIQKIGSSTSPSDDRKVMEEGRVIANSLNVRQGPSASTETIGRLSFGTIVDIYDYSGNWALIKFNGQWAYTHKDYLVTRKPGEGSGLGNLVIAIDPGHGGKDPGAVGNGLREKDVVLGAGLELNKRLKDLGASTVMTRNNDTFLELSQRAKIANDAKADLFISIHANAAASASATGTETYWNNSHSSEESKALAEAINKRLVEDLGMRDRGAKQANFVVIRETKMPSVLIELGFITNSRDAAVMKRSDFNEVVAKAVIKGIEDFYNW